MNLRRYRDETVDGLIGLGRQLRNEVKLGDVPEKLKSSFPDDRLDSIIFSMSHLFYSGAIAESHIIGDLGSRRLPDLVTSHSDFDYYDKEATFLAWQGGSFDNTRNIIGSIAFLVAILFFFESFAKLAAKELDDKDFRRASEIVDWLKSKIEGREINMSSSRLEAIRFLNEYRNAWHDFGLHACDKKSVVWGDLVLDPGARVPIVTRVQSLELLRELVAVVVEVNYLIKGNRR